MDFRSLGCLKQCIQVNLQNAKSKSQPPAHVPYRNSKLTMLLKECFDPPSGSSGHYTVFIAHIAPLASMIRHTKNTLGYAMEMVQISMLEQQKKKFVGED